MALISTSAPISEARRAAAVSVVKNGLPVPPAKITTRPFSRCRSALRLMYGSAMERISSAVMTRVCTPRRSRASCMQMALITVASMPMWSAATRSIPGGAEELPRKMLPPPTTSPSRTPRRVTSTTCEASRLMVV